jgi:hypothetical protein
MVTSKEKGMYWRVPNKVSRTNSPPSAQGRDRITVQQLPQEDDGEDGEDDEDGEKEL